MADIPVTISRGKKFLNGATPVVPGYIVGDAPDPNQSSSDGPSTFLGLTDVDAPSAYVGQAGKVWRVNAGETKLEAYTIPTVDVLGTQLTGYTVGGNTALAATDTILGAFQKVQGQINARVSGTIAAGQVAFGTGVNAIGGDGGFIWDNVNKRLGIGGTPLFNFDVFGESRLAGTVEFSSFIGVGKTPSNNVRISANGIIRVGGSQADNRIMIAPQFGGTNNLHNLDNNNGTLRFFREDFTETGVGINGVVLMSLTNDGSLGILTTPTNTLDVNGTARIRTIDNGDGFVLTKSATGVVTASSLVKEFTSVLSIGDTALDYMSWDNTSKTFGIFSQAQYLHKYRGGAAGALNMGQFDVSGNASINNTSNANLLLATNNISRLEILAAGDVLLKKVDNGAGNFLTIDATTGQLRKRTAAEVGGDLTTTVVNLTSVTLTDEGGGATYSYSGSPNNFWLVTYGGRKFIQIEMSNITTTGTPTGNLLISFAGATINSNYIGAYIESIDGSNITNIEKRIPVMGTSNTNIRLALKDNRTSYASAVTITSGRIRLIIPAT